MKSARLFFFFITLAFCATTAFPQGEANITLDLRPGLAENAGVVQFARDRVAPADANVRAPESAAAGKLERNLFELLNSERRSQGLPVLEWSEEVAAVARLHSQNMASEKFFSHRGSDGSMVDDRADRLGLGAWKTIGENIAYMRGFEDPAALAVEKWMQSAAHRKNLLGTNWKESAVGVSITGDGTYYLTQVFMLRK